METLEKIELNKKMNFLAYLYVNHINQLIICQNQVNILSDKNQGI